MYKVLIADDEWMIREGVKRLIPWEEYGFEIIGLASNGQEALDLYREMMPDLIVSDIRMPIMDGLALIKKIRAENDTVDFLVLSGYADFHYAKQAIGQRVAGYLLKPLDEDELIGYIKTIASELKQKERASKMRERSLQMEREELVLKLVHQERNWKELEFEWERLGLYAAGYQVLLLDTEITNLQIIRAKLNQLSVSFTTGRLSGLVLCYTASHVSKRNWENILLASLPEGVKCGLGKRVTKYQAIYSSYKSAEKRLALAFYAREMFVLDDAIPTIEERIKSIAVFEERLFLALDMGDIAAAKQTIHAFVDEMEERVLDEEKLKNRTISMMMNVVHRLIATSSLPKVWAKKGYEGAEKVQETSHIQHFRNLLVEWCSQLGGQMAVPSTDAAVKKMKAIMHHRYNESLRLDTLSSLLNYNSAYLGKLFKQETGDYFNTYLDKVRIEKGKELLNEGYKVYETAEKIGYANVDYFHRKFKKYTGESPSAFRKKRQS
ncbi:response regulator transcription factor [Bacillus sp. JCM 19041]|uniref:response regulator transcription factor n=1 Tax=Bacillus sp. JCM 19041 TaxID=1460637 RepID=UPI0006D17F68